MASTINQLLAAAIDFGVAEAEQYKPQIISAMTAAEVNADKAADLFINSIKVNGALGIILPALKGALIQAVDAAIARGEAQDDILFGLVITAAQNEAARLVA